eukprot:3566473-Prymnesium_polylepis.5
MRIPPHPSSSLNRGCECEYERRTRDGTRGRKNPPRVLPGLSKASSTAPALRPRRRTPCLRRIVAISRWPLMRTTSEDLIALRILIRWLGLPGLPYPNRLIAQDWALR